MASSYVPSYLDEELSALRKRNLTKARLREFEQPPAADLVSLLKQKEEEVNVLQVKLEDERKEKREKEEEVIKWKIDFLCKHNKITAYHREERDKIRQKLKLAEEQLYDFFESHIAEYDLQNDELTLHSVLKLIKSKDIEIQTLNEAVKMKEEQENKFAATIAEKDEAIRKLKEENVKSVTSELAQQDLIRTLRQAKLTRVYDLIQQDLEIRMLKRHLDSKDMMIKKVTEELTQKCNEVHLILNREIEQNVELKREIATNAAELELKSNEIQQLKKCKEELLEHEKKKDEELKKERARHAFCEKNLDRMKKQYQVSSRKGRELRMDIKHLEDENEKLKPKVAELQAEADAGNVAKEMHKAEINYYQQVLKDIVSFLRDYGVESEENFVEDQIKAGLHVLVDDLQDIQQNAAVNTELKEDEIEKLNEEIVQCKLTLKRAIEEFEREKAVLQESLMRETMKAGGLKHQSNAGQPINQKRRFKKMMRPVRPSAQEELKKENEKEKEKEREEEKKMEEENKKEEEKKKEMKLEEKNKEEEEKEKGGVKEKQEERKGKGKGKQKVECSYNVFEVEEEEQASTERRIRSRRM